MKHFFTLTSLIYLSLINNIYANDTVSVNGDAYAEIGKLFTISTEPMNFGLTKVKPSKEIHIKLDTNTNTIQPINPTISEDFQNSNQNVHYGTINIQGKPNTQLYIDYPKQTTLINGNSTIKLTDIYSNDLDINNSTTINSQTGETHLKLGGTLIIPQKYNPGKYSGIIKITTSH